MFNPSLLPCFIGTAAIVSFAPAVQAQAINPMQVAALAKATVVRIEPTIASPGSGVIIGRYREGNSYVYVVLTARHVVEHSDDEYYIITPQPYNQTSSSKQPRQKIMVSESSIERLKDADLAIVRFKSDRLYAVAPLGNSDFVTEGSGVYISGFPNPGATIRRRVFQFTASLVSSRLDLAEDIVEGEEIEPIEGGYAIVYTNITRAGMSGGPVFDVAGRVVGIHGLGDGDRIAGTDNSTSQTETGSVTNFVKSGFNLGIPIHTFIQQMPEYQKFGIAYQPHAPGSLNNDSLALFQGSQQHPGKMMNLVEQESMDNDLFDDQTSNTYSSNPSSNSYSSPSNYPNNSNPTQPPYSQPSNTDSRPFFEICKPRLSLMISNLINYLS
jgi:V8-like Glu-specific endopeptidase